jgi:hypothetical protein
MLEKPAAEVPAEAEAEGNNPETSDAENIYIISALLSVVIFLAVKKRTVKI